MEAYVLAGKECVHKCLGKWYFQPSLHVCVEIDEPRKDGGYYVLEAEIMSGREDSIGYRYQHVTVNGEIIPEHDSASRYLLGTPGFTYNYFRGFKTVDDVKQSLGAGSAREVSTVLASLPVACLQWAEPFASKRVDHLWSVPGIDDSL